MKRKAWYKRWWIWVILGIISTIFFAIVGACSDETVEDINNTSIVATESTTITQITIETEIMTTDETTIKETEIETTATEAKIETVAEENSVEETYYEEPNTEAEIYIEEYVEEEPEDNRQNYVLNNNSYKFHYPSCSSVNRIKSHNREDYYGTREELINMGYEACKICYP